MLSSSTFMKRNVVLGASLCIALFACATHPAPTNTWRTLVVPPKAALEESDNTRACAALRGLSLAVAQRGAGDASLAQATQSLFNEFQQGKLAATDAHARANGLMPAAAGRLRVEFHDETTGFFRLKEVALYIDNAEVVDKRGHVGCAVAARDMFEGSIAPGRHDIVASLAFEGTTGYLTVYTWRLKDRLTVDVTAAAPVVVKVHARENRSRAPETAEEWPIIEFAVTPEASRVAAPPPQPAREDPLSKADVLKVVKAHLAELASCGGGPGVVKMSWRILPSGAVSKVAIETP